MSARFCEPVPSKCTGNCGRTVCGEREQVAAIVPVSSLRYSPGNI